MRILIVSSFYPPEAQWFYPHELASALVARGHEVTVLTSFPHMGEFALNKSFRGRCFQSEQMDGVTVIRSWIYATTSKRFAARATNFASFCVSSLASGLAAAGRIDIVYAIIPPLPLAVTATILARCKRASLVVNVQDIYPQAAVEHGMLRNKAAIRFFERMEKWAYRQSDRLVVISPGFQDNLRAKGVPAEKICVVGNWADTSFVSTGTRNNAFRAKLGAEGQFVLVYSGTINNNSNLPPFLDAASQLKDEPFLLVIVGDGQFKQELVASQKSKQLDNVVFFPLQPKDQYPEVLRAADMHLVSLNRASAATSVPSKVYKQMAAGRPVLVAAPAENEVACLVKRANCGLCLPPDDPRAISAAVRWAIQNPEQLRRMGDNARSHLEAHHTLNHSVAQIEGILAETIGRA